MKLTTFLRTTVLVAAVLVRPATADDITGAQKVLCTAVQASECYAEGACTPGAPEDWNIPRFLEIDLEQQLLSTTAASGEVRSSSVKNVEREGDRIFIQGVEASRAFSIVLERHVVAVFAYCTPLQTAESHSFRSPPFRPRPRLTSVSRQAPRPWPLP